MNFYIIFYKALPMVKLVSLVLLYASALVAQTVAISLRQDSTSVTIFLFSVKIDFDSDNLDVLIFFDQG